MSGRSSRRDRLAVVLAATACAASGACRKHAPPKPEADPARAIALAKQIAHDVPAPGAVRDCTEGELAGGITMTQLTLLRMAREPVSDRPEHADWTNPPELDSPAARVLADPHADPKAAREAAAEILAAPFYLVYRVDDVNAPMAIGIKEPKIGTIGARVLRYDRTAHPVCVIVYAFQNDKATSDLAIAHSDRAVMDPRIAKALRDDLTRQYLLSAPRGAAAAGSGTPTAGSGAPGTTPR